MVLDEQGQRDWMHTTCSCSDERVGDEWEQRRVQCLASSSSFERHHPAHHLSRYSHSLDTPSSSDTCSISDSPTCASSPSLSLHLDSLDLRRLVICLSLAGLVTLLSPAYAHLPVHSLPAWRPSAVFNLTSSRRV
ncbi:hypothetical protein P389DRAFT_54917 [Cystobasidium minutum MCA 4210]|uniref:uncharacterized protein n=1 Tax=Cystobasidium minutum MCA 4210 TaxID=1397322 RepID=UPI0034CF09DC|eukprot:jgi/Rhomi1/54917/CE54916_47